jgi:signal peptidase I
MTISTATQPRRLALGMIDMARVEVMKKKSKLPLKPIAKWAAAIVSAALILAALGIMLAPHFGWRVDKVMSGSMEHALRVGGMIVTRPVQAEDIKTGDIISYRSPTHPDTKVCHRVVQILETTPPSFQTKGDANEAPDPYSVHAGDIEGKVVFHLPLVGYFAGFARSTTGFILLLIVPGLLIIAGEMRAIWTTLSEMEAEKRLDRTLSDLQKE